MLARLEEIITIIIIIMITVILLLKTLYSTQSLIGLALSFTFMTHSSSLEIEVSPEDSNHTASYCLSNLWCCQNDVTGHRMMSVAHVISGQDTELVATRVSAR